MSRSRLDRGYLKEYSALIGVDEAGRGALAGPVVAAAVILKRECFRSGWYRKVASLVRDSKILTAAQREFIRQIILDESKQKGKLAEDLSQGSAPGLRWGVGIGTVPEIESLNILGATKVAMQRAIELAAGKEINLPKAREDLGPLFPRADETRIIIDGRPLKDFPYLHEGLVGGDDRSFSIALASILAKESRDQTMVELGTLHPQYAFAVHKGYGTKLHRNHILTHGPSIIHRTLFLRKISAE